MPEQAEAFCDTWELDAEKIDMVRKMSMVLREYGMDDEIVKFWRTWMSALKNTQPKLLAYLIYMFYRLLEMRKILKDTGSIYLHCDPTASHYIKILMDGVFGHDNFVNEIAWCYRTGGASKRHWSKKHDVLLMYAKQRAYYFEQQKEPSYLTGQLKWTKTNKIEKDEYGEYQTIVFSSTPIKVYKDKQGYFTVAGCRDYWNIDALGRTHRHRLGYPTQKPIKLLDRIIQASCPGGGRL